MGWGRGREEAVRKAIVDGPELHVESVAPELVVDEYVGVAVAAGGVVGAAVALFEEVFGRDDGAGAASD